MDNILNTGFTHSLKCVNPLKPSQLGIPLLIFLWSDFVDTYIINKLVCFKE